MADTDYTVTVAYRGEVVFIGSPTGPRDTFALIRREGEPARLLCSVTDLGATLAAETCSCCGTGSPQVVDTTQRPPWRCCTACYASGCHPGAACLRSTS